MTIATRSMLSTVVTVTLCQKLALCQLIDSMAGQVSTAAGVAGNMMGAGLETIIIMAPRLIRMHSKMLIMTLVVRIASMVSCGCLL